MFWNTVKKGFGLGFGGRIGWESGGLVWSWLRKLVSLAMLAAAATWGLPMIGDSLATYNQVKQKYEKEAGHAQAQQQHPRSDSPGVSAE